MNRVKVYNAEGICVDSFTKTQTKRNYDHRKGLTFNSLVRFLNSKGYYIKRQLKDVAKGREFVARNLQLSRMSAAIRKAIQS